MVDVEIKGAKSAGRFMLDVELTDDDQGEAVTAVWKIARESADGPKTSQRATDQSTADDQAVICLVRELAGRGGLLTRRALRDHDEAPLGDKRMRSALDRLLEDGRLRLLEGKVSVPDLANHWSENRGES